MSGRNGAGLAAAAALCAALSAGCTPEGRLRPEGPVVNGVSLRLADPPARIREGSWLDLDVVFSNHSAKTVYLPSRTMVSSPSFLFQKLGRGGRRSGEPIYDPGWCQGVLMGDNAVEIPPGGRHRCHLEQDTEMPSSVTGGSTYRVKVSLRYHIHAPTVIGELDDPRARPVAEEDVWRGTVETAPFLLCVMPIPAGSRRTRELWRRLGQSPPDDEAEPVQRVYDVRDLTCNDDVIVQRIRKRLAPSTWDGEKRLVNSVRGLIIVVHDKAVQEAVAAYLADWRRELRRKKPGPSGR